MTLNAWTGLQDPSTPKNIREGEPYTDPQFEELARTYGVWGTAQSALCAEFWQAARRAQVVPNELLEAAQAVIERWDSPNWKDLPATADYIARLRKALAAAPKPPEANSAEFDRIKTETAPVQMPGPDCFAFQHSDGTWHDVSHTRHSAGMKSLYTEHQALQLLADHGIT